MGGSALESALRDGAGEPGLKLIETMLWGGAAFPRLVLHRARLVRSAKALGWPAPEGGESGMRHARQPAVRPRAAKSASSRSTSGLPVVRSFSP